MRLYFTHSSSILKTRIHAVWLLPHPSSSTEWNVMCVWFCAVYPQKQPGYPAYAGYPAPTAYPGPYYHGSQYGPYNYWTWHHSSTGAKWKCTMMNPWYDIVKEIKFLVLPTIRLRTVNKTHFGVAEWSF